MLMPHRLTVRIDESACAAMWINSLEGSLMIEWEGRGLSGSKKGYRIAPGNALE